MSWMEKPLDLKPELYMEEYLEQFLHNHPKGMTAQDLETEELNIVVQAIGGYDQQ